MSVYGQIRALVDLAQHQRDELDRQYHAQSVALADAEERIRRLEAEVARLEARLHGI